jgi:hypothetical protein
MTPVANDALGDWRDQLEDIARRLARLCPSAPDPEQYFIEKSELIAELRKIARTGEAP